MNKFWKGSGGGAGEERALIPHSCSFFTKIPHPVFFFLSPSRIPFFFLILIAVKPVKCKI